jgi:transcriptional regulator with XRE-family HTH domain
MDFGGWKKVSSAIALHIDVQYVARMQAISMQWLYSSVMAEELSHLRKLRIASGLSLRELARQINQQPTNVSFWERTGKTPNSDVLVDMARVLGVSIEEILGQTPARKSTNPAGRLGRTFDAVSKLPRRQQQKIIEVVEALCSAQS